MDEKENGASTENVKSGKSGKSGKSKKTLKVDIKIASKEQIKNSKVTENRSNSAEDLEGGGDKTSKRQSAKQAGKSVKEKAKTYNQSIVGRVISLSLNAVPIAMIVIGALNLENCPIEKMIPIWLIVGGSLYVINTIVDIFTCFERERRHICVQLLDALLALGMSAWLIVGSVWVYSIFSDVEFSVPQAASQSGNATTNATPRASQFCDKLTYYFSMVVITVAFCVFLLLFCCLACVASVAFLTARGNSSEVARGNAKE